MKKTCSLAESQLLLDIAFELGDKLDRRNSDHDNFQLIIDTIGKRMGWDYGEVWFPKHIQGEIAKSDIVYLDKKQQHLSELDTYRSQVAWKLNEGIPGLAWGLKKAIWIPSLGEEYAVHHKDILLRHNVKTCVAVPVFSEEHIIAVLFFMSLSKKQYSEQSINLLEMLAGRLGLLIIKIDLEREMEHIKIDLKHSMDLNFATLNKILLYRDPYTVEHQKKVTEIAVKIAAAMHFDEASIKDLVLAAQLHDIGKLGIPIEILNKPGPINKEEIALIQTHVGISNDLVSSLPCSDQMIRTIREHHERNDGSGYPNGLVSEDIAPLSKVLIIADVISAMREDRPYRKGMDKASIIRELEKGKGRLYDSTYVSFAITQISRGLL